MNAQAIGHEGAIVDVYSKMKPDSFTLQLQTILTSFYEDIKGVVSASSCTKSKVVKLKHKFEDRTCARRRRRRRLRRRCRRRRRRRLITASPATSPEGGTAATPDGEGPALAPSPGRAGAGAGGARGGWQ